MKVREIVISAFALNFTLGVLIFLLLAHAAGQQRQTASPKAAVESNRPSESSEEAAGPTQEDFLAPTDIVIPLPTIKRPKEPSFDELYKRERKIKQRLEYKRLPVIRFSKSALLMDGSKADVELWMKLTKKEAKLIDLFGTEDEMLHWAAKMEIELDDWSAAIDRELKFLTSYGSAENWDNFQTRMNAIKKILDKDKGLFDGD